MSRSLLDLTIFGWMEGSSKSAVVYGTVWNSSRELLLLEVIDDYFSENASSWAAKHLSFHIFSI